MATIAEIAENLLQLNEAKQAIKTAIENKGQDLTDIPFTGYAEKIAGIVLGRKFTTGTITFTSTLAQQTITHNLGVVPTIFLLYAKISEDELNYGVENETGNRGWNYGYRYFNCKSFSDILNFNGSNSNEGGTLSQIYSTYIYAQVPRRVFTSCSRHSVNETKITTGFSASYHYYPTNVEFGWIAIE